MYACIALCLLIQLSPRTHKPNTERYLDHALNNAVGERRGILVRKYTVCMCLSTS